MPGFFTQDDLALIGLMSDSYSKQVNVEAFASFDSQRLEFLLKKSQLLSEFNQKEDALKTFEFIEVGSGLSAFDIKRLPAYMGDLILQNNWSSLISKLPEYIKQHPSDEIFKEYHIQALGN